MRCPGKNSAEPGEAHLNYLIIRIKIVSQIRKSPISRAFLKYKRVSGIDYNCFKLFLSLYKSPKMRISVFFSLYYLDFFVSQSYHALKKRPKGVGRLPEAHYTCHVPDRAVLLLF